jgi:hypothetical protein
MVAGDDGRFLPSDDTVRERVLAKVTVAREIARRTS